MDKVLLKVVAGSLSDYRKAKGLFSEKCMFRPSNSNKDMVFVVRRLREIRWKAGVPFFM